MPYPRLKIALSDCLQGTPCRPDGSDAADNFVIKHLAEYADFHPFCPEQSVLGTPREPIRQVKKQSEIRFLGTQTGSDHTDSLMAYTEEQVPKLLSAQVDGAVVKSRSPTCGLERIRVYGEEKPAQNGSQAGFFTAHLMQSAPNLAIEEEGRLQDAWLRENFMVRIFTVARWREFTAAQPTLSQFQAFHRNHKYLFLTKHEGLYREMGALVATTRPQNLNASLLGYQHKLMQLLAYRTSKGHMKRVTDKIYGYFRKQLTEAEKTLYQETSSEFMRGIVPLITVIKLLEHFLSVYGSSYLSSQVFFHPYPDALALRSKINAFR